MGREPVGVGDLVRGCAMTAQARRIDETRLRRALSRVLAPALALMTRDEIRAEISAGAATAG